MNETVGHRQRAIEAIEGTERAPPPSSRRRRRRLRHTAAPAHFLQVAISLFVKRLFSSVALGR